MASRGGARESKSNLPQKVERLRRKGAKCGNARVGWLHRLPVFDASTCRKQRTCAPLQSFSRGTCCFSLIDSEVSDKGGLSGIAIKAG
jgi:hypothetical protein